MIINAKGQSIYICVYKSEQGVEGGIFGADTTTKLVLSLNELMSIISKALDHITLKNLV